MFDILFRLNYANGRRTNAYVADSDNSGSTQTNQHNLGTLDRRPNRPTFHHMGPLPASRRGGPPYVNRYQPQQIGKRMGVLGTVSNKMSIITFFGHNHISATCLLFRYT